MRKTKIHAILTEISNTARQARKISDGTAMCEYNGTTNRRYLLEIKDKLSVFCTNLQDEIFE